ncbi:ubiquitin thioesterase OTU1 [Cucumis melo var. makuwa]|uniref:Ubiquitin thioesterase OTU n=1 Tax=Cucumis melo var. makuwa TaxID=1194695 RepID=A0A5D3DIA7_CUCMM|nr:ubiquitin thioesterase OTU1 [Cucumis melo var. makuwa]
MTDDSGDALVGQGYTITTYLVCSSQEFFEIIYPLPTSSQGINMSLDDVHTSPPAHKSDGRPGSRRSKRKRGSQREARRIANGADGFESTQAVSCVNLEYPKKSGVNRLIKIDNRKFETSSSFNPTSYFIPKEKESISDSFLSSIRYLLFGSSYFLAVYKEVILTYTMEGSIIRRVIPSDNSCLFNAVGYVMDHDKHKATELRQVIAATVASDPTRYSEAFLGKPNEEYCSWILDSEKWGGAIELSILSEYYGREIAAYDIQTARCDLYGQEKRYSERVLLIYDGLHYDALVMSPAEDAPEEFDQTIFSVNRDRTIGPIEEQTLHFVKDQQRKRRFTDTANFTLRCGVCQIGVVGQAEAVEHAKATGHVNFQEYR